MDTQEIGTKLEEMEARVASLRQHATDDPSAETVADVKAQLQGMQPEIEYLRHERETALLKEGMDSLNGKAMQLQEAIEELRKPSDFKFSAGGAILPNTFDAAEGKSVYADPKLSYYADVSAARKGDTQAQARLSSAFHDGKALIEGTDSQGGYLVVPEVSAELLQAREQAAILRQLVSKVQVNSDRLQIGSISGGLTAGWVAELAEKPESSTLSFGQIEVNVYTGAGLATISNQLLADSRPSVDRLVTSDLAKRLAFLEELAMLNGDGIGKPLGILQTPGTNPVPFTGTAITGNNSLRNALLDAILAMQDNYHGEPSAILMHPRTWTWILKDPDAVNAGLYNLNGERAFNALPGKTLLGYPVILSSKMPTNLGTGTNESAIIVGNFSEALILDRQGITIDRSEHVKFTSNQTVFRAEFRMGFTAARYPKAFSIVSGSGLANH